MNSEMFTADDFGKMFRRVAVVIRDAEMPLSFADIAEQTGLPEHLVAYCLGQMFISLRIEFGEVVRFSKLPRKK